MIGTLMQAAAWLIAYLALVCVSTGVFYIAGIQAGRGWWHEFGSLLGFVLLVMLGLQFVLTGRFKGLGRPFGVDIVVQFHRYVGIFLVLLFLAHPLVLIWFRPAYIEFLDPRVNALRAIFLSVASFSIVLLIAMSLWRTAFGLTYEWWRVSHAVLSALVVFIGVVHAWQVGHHVDGPIKRGWLICLGALPLGCLAYLRLYRPWQMRARPYRVAEVREERGESTTLTLEPVGHPGMPFRAGQYAWLTIGKSPFTLQQHPFSFSSSDRDAPGRLEFTAKELGDFTTSLTEVDVGTPAFLEGPYGEFVLDDDALGAVFVMGGIGVTPAISMLRSMRDRADSRPVLLLYGSPKWRETTFRKELESLRKELDLRVVYVISDPDPEWDGESGYIDREILERYIGERERGYSFFVCGPDAMISAVEEQLLAIGISLKLIRAERFNFV